jgi:hypothetical protein
MRRITLWGAVAIISLGVVAYLFSPQIGSAQPVGPFDINSIGIPGDLLADDTHDRPGVDRRRDRQPDSSSDRVNDGSPDCVGNFSNDGNDRNGGNCNSAGGNTASGDGTPEDVESDGDSFNAFGIPDGDSAGSHGDGDPGCKVCDAIPDASRIATINRALDRATDFTPDWVNSDQYRNAQGLSSTAGDGTPDGFSNTDVRAHDSVNDSLPDGLNYAFGPGDQAADDHADYGGLGHAGTGTGGGTGGCSMVAAHAATAGSSLAYLMLLLAPVAAVVVRRRLRRS